MADAEDIQPLVCDNGTGMVKVKKKKQEGKVNLFSSGIAFVANYIICMVNSNTSSSLCHLF